MLFVLSLIIILHLQFKLYKFFYVKNIRTCKWLNATKLQQRNKMKKTLTLLLITMTVICFSGCATVFTGSYDNISIESRPAGAQILVNGVERGTTPASVRVRRNLTSADITVRFDGYETRTFRLEQEFNPVSVLNLFNPLFWGIDAATGSMLRYRPHFYEINLQPRSATEFVGLKNQKKISDLEMSDDKYLIRDFGSIAISEALPDHILIINRVR